MQEPTTLEFREHPERSHRHSCEVRTGDRLIGRLHSRTLEHLRSSVIRLLSLNDIRLQDCL